MLSTLLARDGTACRPKPSPTCANPGCVHPPIPPAAPLARLLLSIHHYSFGILSLSVSSSKSFCVSATYPSSHPSPYLQRDNPPIPPPPPPMCKKRNNRNVHMGSRAVIFFSRTLNCVCVFFTVFICRPTTYKLCRAAHTTPGLTQARMR